MESESFGWRVSLSVTRPQCASSPIRRARRGGREDRGRRDYFGLPAYAMTLVFAALGAAPIVAAARAATAHAAAQGAGETTQAVG